MPISVSEAFAMMNNLNAWHAFWQQPEPSKLAALLHDDVVFHSPVVHRPQPGKQLTMAYLLAAVAVLGNDSFRYVREIVGEGNAALEFVTEVEGVEINGVDLITWNDDGLITDFKVMVRPLKAINTLHALMAAQLQK
jgi:hypothetical protein